MYYFIEKKKRKSFNCSDNNIKEKKDLQLYMYILRGHFKIEKLKPKIIFSRRFISLS